MSDVNAAPPPEPEQPQAPVPPPPPPAISGIPPAPPMATPPPPPPAAVPPPPPPPIPGAVTPGATYAAGTMAGTSTNGFAIAALICGILGVVTCGYTFFVLPALAVIFGVVAKKQIPQRGQQGSGLAIAGLVLGIIGLVICALVIFVFGLALFSSGTTSYTGT